MSSTVPGFDGWLEPWWFERQVDPQSPDFVPGAPRDNLTQRSWTLLGNLGSGARGVVDPRGLLAVADCTWSLDWWVGGDDRWYLPSREVAVRQRLVDDAPVVETVMRIAGGDARHRAFGFRSAGDHLAVEIGNDTPVPFAVALVVRPAGPLGRAQVHTIDLDDRCVIVDGRPSLVLPKRPALTAVGSKARGDVVHAVTGGRAEPEWHGPIRCDQGRATAAFILPLPHQATLRVAAPLGAPASARGCDPDPPAIPDGARVARGWSAQTEVGARIVVPDDRLQSAFDAARRHLLLAHGGDDVASWPGRDVGWTEAASIVTALDRWGHHAESEQLLATMPERQALDGRLVAGDEGPAANGAGLHALAEHWSLVRDHDLVDSLVGAVAKAGHWIAKRRRARRRRLADGPVADVAWCIAGLRGAAWMLGATGQPEVADDLAAFAAALESDLRAVVDRTRERHGVEALAATGDGGLDGRVVENLVAAWVGALGPDDPWMRATADWVRTNADADGAVFDLWRHRGSSARHTIWLAALELAAGDRRGLDRVGVVLGLASPTWAWPEITHPRSGGGSAGDGHHGATTADFCTLVRRLLVVDGDGELVLCPTVPDTWLGQSWEVHDLPTRSGRLGFAVRWHGDRPAVLWQLDLHPGERPPRLRAPGLDPSWGSNDARGDALLAPVRGSGPEGRSPASSGSFS